MPNLRSENAGSEAVLIVLQELVDILDDIRLFFQCENWFPLYESTMYNAVCYDGTDGFAWIA